MGAAAIAVVTGGLLWFLLHRGALGTQGHILVIGAFCALLGTLVGVFTIIIGIGPRTKPDIAYHVAIVAVLIWGLVAAARSPTGDAVP